jgi:anthranilate synthase component 1
MTPQQFAALAAQDYNRIPVSREVLADTETPLSAYIKLAGGPYSYLLESVQGGEKWGRYSIIGLPCRTRLKVCGYQVEVITEGLVVEQSEVQDPLAFVEAFQQRYRIPEVEGLPVFHGGLVGYFGYDTVRYVEPRLRAGMAADELGTPDILLMLSEEIVVFDNLAGTLQLVVNVDPAEQNAWDNAQLRLAELQARLREPTPALAAIDLAAAQQERAEQIIPESEFRSHFTQDEYFAAVESIKEYVLAGDVMQAVPSQRLSLPFTAPPLDLYRALRNLNPSPYMYFLDLEDFHIVGSSPEILARLEEGVVTVRPIAGTRRRGRTEEEDIALEQELLADPKEIAEHLMLIDLGRNDVGRIAKTGSVELTDKMVVEKYSHVMHIVSNVTGDLLPGKTAVDVLRASLPAGTLSGAPKIRAMEIIDELEPVKRGIYGGAVGYISWQGDMDTAIAIRTAVVKDQVLYIQAGGGVVADSVPRLEYKETMNKARAMFRAAAMVKSGAEGGQ